MSRHAKLAELLSKIRPGTVRRALERLHRLVMPINVCPACGAFVSFYVDGQEVCCPRCRLEFTALVDKVPSAV